VEIADLVAEVATARSKTPRSTRRRANIHVGNAFGQLFNGQGQCGRMAATMTMGSGVSPAARHEAACASGSVAILARGELEAGRYDCALVIGVEQERNVPATRRVLARPSWIGHEGADATYVGPTCSAPSRTIRPAKRPSTTRTARESRS